MHGVAALPASSARGRQDGGASGSCRGREGRGRKRLTPRARPAASPAPASGRAAALRDGPAGTRTRTGARAAPDVGSCAWSGLGARGRGSHRPRGRRRVDTRCRRSLPDVARPPRRRGSWDVGGRGLSRVGQALRRDCPPCGQQQIQKQRRTRSSERPERPSGASSPPGTRTPRGLARLRSCLCSLLSLSEDVACSARAFKGALPVVAPPEVQVRGEAGGRWQSPCRTPTAAPRAARPAAGRGQRRDPGRTRATLPGDTSLWVPRHRVFSQWVAGTLPRLLPHSCVPVLLVFPH